MQKVLTTFREVIRHVLNWLGLNIMVETIRGATGRPVAVLRQPTLRERFSMIYQLGVWGGSEGDPSSGRGSSLNSTVLLRKNLPLKLDEMGGRVLLDVGCGDFTWMSATPILQNYIGIDVVPSVIASNIRRFGNERRRFMCLDAVSDDLPEADVVLCREVLFHLSFQDALMLLQNIALKSRKYFLATTDGLTLLNADISSGDHRPLNLLRPPFSFPKPGTFIEDSAVMRERYIGVWKFSDISPLISRTSALGRNGRL